MAINEMKIKWPGWEISEVLGRGSFGTVYKIQRQVHGHTEMAALKVICIPQNSSEVSSLRADGYDDASITRYFADSLEKIENEYAMMAEMKGHSNIVHCEDIRTIQHDDGFGWDIYIKMELLTPLKEKLTQAFSEREVIKLGIDVCNALVLCSQLNIVHRDIKPENIFVSRDGNYKLGDFGIARTMENTTGGTVTGTYEYMAPEVYNNQPYHTAADTYSLGLVMYWLLNNRTGPFLPQGSQKPTPTAKANARSRRFSGEPIPASQNGSEALKKIVLKACAYDPKDRFSSAAEMKEKLEILLYGGVPQDADEATVVGVPRTDGQNMPEERTVGNEVNEKTVYSTPAPSQKEEKILKKKSKVPIWIGGGVAALLAICLIIGGLAQRPKAEKAMEESIPEASEAMVQETVVAETTEPVEDLSPEIQLWIPQQPNHKTIDIGSSHSVGLRQDGTVIAEGNTGLSILNGIEQWQDITAIAAGDDYTVGLKSDGTVVAAGRNGSRECDVDGWSDIIAIDAGYNHTVGLKADGTVVSAGDRAGGKRNVDDWENIVDIAADTTATVGLKSDGTVVATSSALVMLDTPWSDIADVDAGGNRIFGLKLDGTVVHTGPHLNGKMSGECEIDRWKNIVSISCGGSFLIGLKSDGTVVAAGDNAYGQCNVEHWRNIVEIAAGETCTIGLRSDGVILKAGSCDVDFSAWNNIKMPGNYSLTSETVPETSETEPQFENTMTISDVSYYLDGANYKPGINDGAVGEMQLSFVVEPPTENCEVFVVGWYPKVPSQEKIEAVIASMKKVWRSDDEKVHVEYPPFVKMFGHPVDADELGTTQYVLIAGIAEDWSTAGYAIIPEVIPEEP